MKHIHLSPPQTLHVIENLETIPSNAYEFKPSKMKWLARMAWRLLHHLGALEIGAAQTVKTYTFDKQKAETVSELVHKNLDQIYRYFQSPKDWAILMGETTFRDLVMERNNDGQQFMRSIMTAEARLGYRHQIFDVPVHVVPMMEGVVMVPKVLIEKQVEAA